MSDYLSPEQKMKVIESLEKKQATKETIDKKILDKSKEVQDSWDKNTYEFHKKTFEEGYYSKWKANGKYDYKTLLKRIDDVKIDEALKGQFENQLQPGDRFFWKSRHNERKKIEGYKRTNNTEEVNFNKNTVREMAALDHYSDYHTDYFITRNHQRRHYDDYVKSDIDAAGTFQEKWISNINVQSKKFGKFFGSITGSLAAIKSSVIDGLFGAGEKHKVLSRKNELDIGLRPFFSMTKKTLFWKRQVGRLGTETQEEKDDGSEYNKRILKQYTEGNANQRKDVMDELSQKLITFNIEPNMLTNKYMAKNMLKMQRYTDMLTGFVELIKYNPEYLDTTNSEAAHTSPERAALIKSRIILMQPIMTNFMARHAKYFGYKKEDGIKGHNHVNGLKSGFKNEDEYNAFVKETWSQIKQAYNSTADFFDDMADYKMASVLKVQEQLAEQNRRLRNENLQDKTKDDSVYNIKYDADGELSKKLMALRHKISSNPYIYEIYGSDLERLFGKYDEMIRRLDEVKARASSIGGLKETALSVKFKGVENFGEMWNTYLEKEIVRMDSEQKILDQQMGNYEKAIDYLVGQKLDEKNFKLSDPDEVVLNVLKFEGMNHILELKKAFEYNDLFYKNLEYYDFDKYTDLTDKEGKKIEIKDLWSQYNFTILKRGMDRARLVNRLVDGKTVVDINDPSKLNNIEKRQLCKDKFQEAAKKKENYKVSIDTILSTDIGELTEKYKLVNEMDITKDITYQLYFEVESIANIAKALDEDPSGATVEGYNKLRPSQKDELKIRCSLFRDYFNRWQGQIYYTMSEAYEYLGDIPNMQGNNEIIEGIGKQYRKKKLEEITDKIYQKYEDLESQEENQQENQEGNQQENQQGNQADQKKNVKIDEEMKRKIGELSDFFYGMAIANDYDAKSIEIFGKDAYEAYKAKYNALKLRQQIMKVYAADFDEMVEKGYIKGTEEERKAYLNRVETAISLKSEVEKYYNKQLKDPNKPALNPKAGDEEKAKYVYTHYQRAMDIISKFKGDYLDEKNLLANMGSILSDLDYCLDTFNMGNKNDGEGWYLVQKYGYLKEENRKDVERATLILTSMTDLVHATLADYGINNISSYVGITFRDTCKKTRLRNNPKYREEFLEADRKKAEFLKEENKKLKEDDKLEEELKAIEKLYKEEEKKNLELQRKEGSFESLNEEQKKNYVIKGRDVEGKVFIAKRKNKYEEQYARLLSMRRTFKDTIHSVNVMYDLTIGVAESKLELEEKLEDGAKIDYIIKEKQEARQKIEEANTVEPATQYRNFVEELFRYLHKKYSDAELMDPNKVKKALKGASDAWFFQLSAGARREALVRLNEYKKDKGSMNDYFIWKNTQETNENLAERAKPFGQDNFIKNNITTIRKIMDTIAEANACVNDMQTPEFLDILKEDLEVKGIDERQFMFLLRKHNVGISGLGNNVKDAFKAHMNKVDVHKYMKVDTKMDFLVGAARDVLAERKELDPFNINEKYILEHFEECYFTANKMVAFQQLYYGEYESFKEMIKSGGENAKLAKQVQTLFDKGHGEAYALYYNTVMAVANKYGVSANGALNFGLKVEDVEKLGVEGKSDPEITKKVAANLKDADKRTEDSIKAINNSYKINKMAMIIEDAMANSLAGIEIDEKKDDEKLGDDLKKFYEEHSLAYQGAMNFVIYIRNNEQNPKKVLYTKRHSDYPQGMFLMAKDMPCVEEADMLKNLDVATNFKNLFARDERNIGKNLSVIDEDKCKRVMDRLTKMGLVGTGKIGEDTARKKPIIDDSYIDENFSREFFEDMINAQNFCMMFERNDDFLNLVGYEEQVKKAKVDQKNVNEIYKKTRKGEKKADIQIGIYQQEISEINDAVERLKLVRADAEKKGDQATVEKINAQIVKMTDITSNSFGQFLKWDDEKESKKAQAGTLKNHYSIKYADLLTDSKVKTLKKLSEIFSNKNNRYVISTYVDYFQSYLLKNGIKVDGSFANCEIYDDILTNRAIYNEEDVKTDRSISVKEALEVGEDATKFLDENLKKTYELRLENIKKGTYQKDYKSRVEKEKQLAKEEKKAKEAEAKAMEAEKKAAKKKGKK